MKKVILILSVVIFSASCANAAPHMGKAPHVGGHKKPAVVKHHPPKHHPPRHHHTPYYRYYYSCNCLDPYCVHRSHLDTFFRLAPGVSIRVSI